MGFNVRMAHGEISAMRILPVLVLTAAATAVLTACAPMQPKEPGAKLRVPEVVRVSARCASLAQMRLQGAGFRVAGSCGSAGSRGEHAAATIRRRIDPG